MQWRHGWYKRVQTNATHLKMHTMEKSQTNDEDGWNFAPSCNVQMCWLTIWNWLVAWLMFVQRLTFIKCKINQSVAWCVRSTQIWLIWSHWHDDKDWWLIYTLLRVNLQKTYRIIWDFEKFPNNPVFFPECIPNLVWSPNSGGSKKKMQIPRVVWVGREFVQ